MKHRRRESKQGQCHGPMSTVLAVMDCGHSMLIYDLEKIPQHRLPFDKKKALETGTAKLVGPCPGCSEKTKKGYLN